MERAAIGPTGWATVWNGPRERINVNSRGCVELIRAATRRRGGRMEGPYDGWCSCEPSRGASDARRNQLTFQAAVLADRWEWRVEADGNTVRVWRSERAGDETFFEFDLNEPHYRAPTQASLETARSSSC